MTIPSRPETPYHRPNQMWECGRACEGCACQGGPTAWGRCTDATNRCRPRLNLRRRRGWFVLACVLCSIGLLSLGLHPAVRTQFVVPGPLTNPHAQILQRTGQQHRCATCHPNGDLSPRDWFASVLACAKECQTTQTELCLKCHERQIPQQFATQPHNLPREVLDRKTEAQRQRAGDDNPAIAALLNWSGRRDHPDNQQLACSACHREHHGAMFDIKALTDQQCQTCHQGEFHSFSHGHPEFHHYSGESPRQIPFDHVSHANKHFREKNANFDCQRCHESDATGQVQRLVDYRRACSECHDQPLRTVHQQGWVVFALPTIDVERAGRAGVTVEKWPTSAQGDCDGRLPPVLATLLLADPAAAPAVRKLAPAFDLSQLNLESAEQMAVAGTIANGIANLVRELQESPNICVTRRLEAVLRRPLKPEERQRLESTFPAAALAAATTRWFANTPPRVTRVESNPGRVRHHQFQPRTPFRFAAWASSEVLLDNPLSGRHGKTGNAAVEPAATTVAPLPKHSEPTPALVRPQPGPPAEAVIGSIAPTQTTALPRTTFVPPNGWTPAARDGEPLYENPLANRRSGPTELLPPAQVEAVSKPEPKQASEPQPKAEPKVEAEPKPEASAETKLPAAETPPATVPNEPVTDPAAKTPTTTAGEHWPAGWSADDLTLTVRYVPQGHADPVLKLWLEALRLLPSDLEGSGPLQELGRKDTTLQACARCHQWSPEQSPQATSWRAVTRDPGQRTFTKFSHRPHLLQPQLTNCSHCHKLSEPATTLAAQTQASPAAASSLHHDFVPLRKSACVTCHRTGGTSQSCTQCHRYHTPK